MIISLTMIRNKMSLDNRLLIYLLMCLLGTILVGCMEIEYSRRSYKAGDKTSYSWMSFLPFFIPLFLLEAVKYVLPTAVLIEIVIYFFGRK